MPKITCWEYFSCNKRECPVYNSREAQCWLVSYTLCRDEIQGKFLKKMEMCLNCEVFRSNIDLSSMADTCQTLDTQFSEFRDIVAKREEELTAFSLELAVSMSEVFVALKKISKGDPTVRIPEESSIELISKLKNLINLTAADMADFVHQAHEFAIGLAEHFDVLQRVTKDDLNARVRGTSQVELLEALKNVTNRMIENISMEITERKEAEQEVREIEAVESSILSAIPHAVIGLQNRVIYFANESVEAIFGYRPEDLIGEKTRILYRSDEEYEQIGRLFYPELEHKHKHSEDFFCRHKDGRDILCKVNASVIGTHMKDQNIVVVYEDITARRQMEQRIVTAAEEWKETFDSMQHGIMLLTPDFQITQINSYLASLYGSLAHDITHKKCFEIISGCDPEEGCPLLKAAGDRSTETLEHFDPRLGKHFMHYITPIFHKDGSIKNFVFCIIDITEIKQKEAEITQSRNAFFNMLKDIDLSYQDLKGLHEGLIHSFVNAIDTKSKWTKGHSERVTLFSVAIARYMKLTREEIEKLRIASLLHDIGKLGTYDVILDKPGRLNAEEYDLIKKHPEKGAEILKPIKQLQNIISTVMHHHEQIDGSGYPGGLKGDCIPLMARILHVADSYDSMTADRPYRTAPGKEYAISELKKYSGSQFDPLVVEAFLKVLNEKPY